MSKRKTERHDVPRPTHDEQLHKIEFVRILISKGLLKSQIKELFRKRYGPTPENPKALVPSAGTIEDYLRRAKDVIAERVAAGTAEQRNILGEFVWDIMSDAKSKKLEKLKAAELYAKLHGLNAPLQTEVGGIGGGPIQTTAVPMCDLPVEDQEAILRADAAVTRLLGERPSSSGDALASRNGDTHKPG